MRTPRSGGTRPRAEEGSCTASPFSSALIHCVLGGALLLGGPPLRAAETAGDALFATHCATCHGAAGEGDGPAANAMKIAPPNLRALAKRNGGQFPRDAIESYIDGRKQVEAHGDRLMPVWGDFLQMPADKGDPEPMRRRIAALADFIERLQYR